MPATRNFDGLETGQNLTFVVHIENMPHSEQVTVHEAEPFIVEAHASWCRLLRRGMRIVLLRPMEGDFAKAEVEIVSIQKFRNSYRLGFSAPAWNNTDRRQFPRFDVQVPITIRRVDDCEGIIHFHNEIAVTEDLSAGGAWIFSKSDTAAGTVVQVDLTLHGQPCRTLAVVVRNESDREGYAVEFLDFVGASRYALSEFLRQAA
jgi:hypothetical protein